MVKGDDDNNSLADEDANLMVKLKFLTYKVYMLFANRIPTQKKNYKM